MAIGAALGSRARNGVAVAMWSEAGVVAIEGGVVVMAEAGGEGGSVTTTGVEAGVGLGV